MQSLITLYWFVMCQRTGCPNKFQMRSFCETLKSTRTQNLEFREFRQIEVRFALLSYNVKKLSRIFFFFAFRNIQRFFAKFPNSCLKLDGTPGTYRYRMQKTLLLQNSTLNNQYQVEGNTFYLLMMLRYHLKIRDAGSSYCLHFPNTFLERAEKFSLLSAHLFNYDDKASPHPQPFKGAFHCILYVCTAASLKPAIEREVSK